MNSSGIKRGLAGSAVAALAVTGLPFLASSASAVPASSQVASASDVILVAPMTDMSARNDGQNTTVRLEALGGNDVAQVRFEYSLNPSAGTPTWNTITTVGRNDDGAFSHEWDPNAVAGAPEVAVRAVALSAAGAAGDTDQTAAVTVNNTLSSVNINDGTGVGVFQATYTGHAAQNVVVSGTSSDPASTPDLEFWDPSTRAFVAAGTADSTSADNATTGTWTGVADITGYDYGTGDQLVLRAEDGTDDAESFGLYKQTITAVTATADKTQVQANGTAKVTVKVLDQNGLPVAGAEVVPSGGTVATDAKYTEADGTAVFNQGAGTAYYYANANDSDPYEPELGDKKSDNVTITQYAPAETNLKATSRDGDAFDIGEFAYNGDATVNSDITLQVTDQNGNPIKEANREVRYYWEVTAFDGNPADAQRSPASNATPNYKVATTNANGVVEIDRPTVTDENGTWKLYASLQPNVLGNGGIANANVLTVKAGDSTLEWTNGDPAQAKAGTSFDATGELVLGDGTGLPGRSVKVDYDGTSSGIVLANGTTGGTRTVTTDAAGKFSVTVKDVAATPQTEETGRTLTANTVPGTTDNDDPDEGPATLGVEFLNNVTPGIVTITADNGDSKDVNVDGKFVTPGEIKAFKVKVTTGDNDPNTAGDQVAPLSNAQVTLTLDHGYFTDGKPVATPVAQGDAGAYHVLGTDNGKTMTATTDGNGEVTVLVAIGRDEGFDDDGMVKATLSAKAGDVAKTATQDWDSSNPLNGGEVKIVESPADRQDGPTDPAPVNSDVRYDVFTTDQFDNLVGGEDVTISVDDPDADLSGLDNSGQVKSDFDSRGEFDVTSSRAGTYTVTGSWKANTYRYTVAGGTGTPSYTADNETVTGSADAEFYAVDFAASTFTITSDPEGTVPAGSAVTETVTAVDQEGNPIPNLSVRFAVAGPGDQTSDVERFTNANGQAFYTVIGNSEGTANVNAVITDGEQVQTVSDSITFGKGDTGNPVLAHMKLKGIDKGKRDVIRVDAIDAASGAKVTLFKRKANGSLKRIKSAVLNDKGNFSFRVHDGNGAKATRYTVKLQGNDAVRPANKSRKVK